ncbi:MAG: PIN domain-containing protein [Candidatus Sulfotelmatobacter sp.]
MIAPASAERHPVGHQSVRRPSVRPGTSGSPVFVDTNVFLYAIDEADPRKQHAARQWRAELWKSRRGRVSFQVLGEFYVNAVRLRPKARDEARGEVRDLLAWNPVVADAALLERGWKLQDRYQLSYWDALIVAAAKAANCLYLLTEDLQAGQELEGVEVVNPFERRPESLL